MEFSVLGPLRARANGVVLPLRGPREQKILAMLLLHAGQVVSLERLVETLWDAEPPATAATQVRNRISELRRAWSAELASREELLATEAGGYVLRLADHELDLHVFDERLRAAQQAVAAHDLPVAVERMRAALGCWQGPALAGLTGRVIEAAADRLNERRLAAVEECIGHELALGRHADLLTEVAILVERHPFRERLVQHLMLALYRSGQQAAALAAYQRCVALLRDELGLDPMPGLQSLQQAILRRSPEVEAPTPPAAGQPAVVAKPVPRAAGQDGAEAVAAPAELPAGVLDFTGRVKELEWLEACLDAADSAQAPALMIVAITGTGGVGKTALAVHWAHRVAQRFPDGQVYANLHGFGQAQPANPADILAALLRTLGVSADQVPLNLDEAARWFRSLVADRRMLLLLDNAASAEQVRPLLPGSPGSVVVVTSRDRLSGLVASHGARRLTVDPMSTDEANALLMQILGRYRVEREPEAVARLVDACAALPLTLRIAAANLDSEPGRSVADFLTGLDREDRVDALRIDGDSQAVQAVFDASYARLSPDVRRIFRLIGLAPGPDLTSEAMAALAGIPAARAERLIGPLTNAHLLGRNAADRFATHDLLRLYARKLAWGEDTEAERLAATERLYWWYLDHARAAAAMLHPHMLRLCDIELAPATATFENHSAAVAWLDAERPSLIAAVEQAGDRGVGRMAWLLADVLRGYFWLCGLTADWIAVAQHGHAAASREQNLRGQAATAISLGFAYYSLGQYDKAIDAYQSALDAGRAARWPAGEATALGNLGLAHANAGNPSDAVHCLAAAAHIDRRLDRRLGLATTLSSLGQVDVRLGQPHKAIQHLEEAIDLYRRAGSRSGEAMAAKCLAYALRVKGRYAEALHHAESARRTYREVGDRYGEAAALDEIARTHLEAGQADLALEQAEQALLLAHDTDRSRLLAALCNTLGQIFMARAQPRQAMKRHERALKAIEVRGHRYHESEAHLGLAHAELALGQHRSALASAQRALKLAERVEFRIVEGDALIAVAQAQVGLGNVEDALRCGRLALSAHRRTGYPAGVDRARAVLATCHRRTASA